MTLTAPTLVQYLLGRGLLTPRSVVDGDVIVVDITRRNRNFKVIRKKGPSYFVKQAKADDPQTGPLAISTLQIEAAVHQLARSDAGFAALASILPPFYGYDVGRHTLLLGLVSETEDVRQYHRRLGNYPVALAALLATTLSRVHREVVPGETYRTGMSRPETGLSATLFSGRMPWILTLPQVGAVPTASGGNQKLRQIIGQYPRLQFGLLAMQREWRVNAFTHGDMKWENILVACEPRAAGATQGRSNGDGTLPQSRLTITDWELADVGDACWDAAAIVQMYLADWLLSMPIDGGSADRMIERAAVPLAMVQPPLQTFWRTYVAGLGLDSTIANRWLERAVGYAAVRLIQTAYEHLQFSDEITPTAMCLLQVSLNMLASPRDAIGTLLGM